MWYFIDEDFIVDSNFIFIQQMFFGCFVPDTVLSSWVIDGNQTDRSSCSHGAYTLVGGDNNLSQGHLR